MQNTFEYPPMRAYPTGYVFTSGDMTSYVDDFVRMHLDDLTPDELAEAVKYIKAKRPVTEPFDLERAQAGAQLVTRGGRKVRFLAYVPEALENSRVVVFVDGDLTPTERFFNGTLSFWKEGPGDLLIAVPAPQPPAPVTYWAAMGDCQGDAIGALYKVRGDAVVRAGTRGYVQKVQVCL